MSEPLDALGQLMALIPDPIVNVRAGPLSMQLSRHIVKTALRYALENEHAINRTNGEGPLHEWDGWLELETDDVPHLIETKHAKAKTNDPPPN